MIDARHDGGGVVLDDAGSDAGCAVPSPPAFDPIDTMGPAGETLSACLARVGAQTDDRIPADQSYDLTTFGGPGDEQPVACAGLPIADGTWWYVANAQRFACGQHVRLVDAARTHCAIAEVADVGPSACVEEAGARPIWDASPLVSQQLFGVDSAGYSDHLGVLGAPVGSDNALGPCDAALADPSSYARGFIGGPCGSEFDCDYDAAECFSDWPGGTCSLPCDTTCPDRAGAFAYTACARLDDGVGHCVARCDYTLFETGCRPRYACEERMNPASGAVRRVCVPASC